MMNFDDLAKVWHSQDLSPLYSVDRNVLHQVLWQDRHLSRQRQLEALLKELDGD